MKIIKEGKLPTNDKEFTCKYCDTVFEASYGEYERAEPLEYFHDGIVYKCKCPICGKTAYIFRY